MSSTTRTFATLHLDSLCRSFTGFPRCSPPNACMLAPKEQRVKLEKIPRGFLLSVVETAAGFAVVGLPSVSYKPRVLRELSTSRKKKERGDAPQNARLIAYGW